MVDRTLNLKALSDQIGVDKGQLSKEAKRPGFPKNVAGDGRAYFNAEEVLRWRASNIPQRRAAGHSLAPAPAQIQAQSQPLSLPALPAIEPLAKENDPFIQLMRSGMAKPIDITRAAAQLASRRVANAAVAGELGINELDDLKKSLQELRQAESDYINLAVQQGELIDRDAVRAIIGTCCSRLVQVLAVVENSIALEVDQWLNSDEFRGLSVDDRRRSVREYVAKLCADVRRQEAAGVDALINAEIAEGQAT